MQPTEVLLNLKNTNNREIGGNKYRKNNKNFIQQFNFIFCFIHHKFKSSNCYWISNNKK